MELPGKLEIIPVYFLLGGEGHSIDVHVVSHCISEGGEGVIEASHCQHIVISWPNLGLTKIIKTWVQQKFSHLSSSPSFHRLHNNHHNLHENLKLIIDSHISLIVKVLEGDVKAVIAYRGNLVDSF